MSDAATAAPYFDWSTSFDQLQVGQAFTTNPRPITAGDVDAFAELTGDHHPQHTDSVWATSSSFGEQIAHGMLIISAAAGLVPFDPDRVIALRKLSEVTFKRPIFFNDRIQVVGSISELRPISDEAGLVTFTWKVINQEEKLVCRAKVEVVWGRDLPSAP